MYEHLSFTRSRVWKFLEARRFPQRVQHRSMHQSPPFNGSRRFRYAIDETELMVTNALRGGKAIASQ